MLRRKRRRRYTPRRRRRSSGVARLLFAAGALVFLAWGGLTWARQFIGPPLMHVAVLEHGTLMGSIQSTALVVRSERVVEAPIGGAIIRIAQEGDRVRAGDVVVEIVDRKNKEKLEEEVVRLEAALAAFDSGEGTRMQELAATAQELAARERDVAWEMNEHLSKGDVAAYLEAYDRLQSIVADRARYEAELAALEESRQRLVDELEQARLSLGELYTQVLAPGPGVVSYFIDDLHQVLTPEGIFQLTSQDVLGLRVRGYELADGDEVGAGEGLFRIVDNLAVYLVASLSEEQVARLKAADRITVTIAEDDLEVVTELYHVSDTLESGYRVAILRTEQFQPLLARRRRLEVQIHVAGPSGVLIPLRALVGDDAVYVMEGSRPTLRPVRLMASDDQWAVTEDLPEGTAIVTNPWVVRVFGIAGESGR